jgi:hypothetical protein
MSDTKPAMTGGTFEGSPVSKISIVEIEDPWASREIDTPWTTSFEISAKLMGENVQAYKFMHMLTSNQYARKFKISTNLSLFLPVLSAVFTATSLVLWTDQKDTYSTVCSVMAICCSAAAGYVASVIKNSRYQHLSHKHKEGVSGYSSLENNIRRQLALPRHNRVNPSAYIAWLSHKKEDLWTEYPTIPQFIKTRYRKLTGLDVDKQTEIIINIDSSTGSRRNKSRTNSEDNDKNPLEEVPAKKFPVSEGLHHSFKESSQVLPEHYPVEEKKRFSDGMMEYEMKRMGLDLLSSPNQRLKK